MAHARKTSGGVVEREDIEIDEAYDDDDAVSLSTTAFSSATTSLTDSIFDYTYSNGRRYHGERFNNAAYFLPNDEEEQDRLDLYHHLFLLLLDGGLYTAPLDKPQTVLDIGTGTGIWAIDFADEHPQAEVVGVDISPIQPRWVPPNVKFEVDDVEAEWTFKAPFDYIHLRTMAGSIADWPKLLKQCYQNTKPGGFVEFQDYCLDVYLSDGTPVQGLEMGKQHPIAKYVHHVAASIKKLGRSLDVPPFMESYLQEAGFVDVVVTRKFWPMGGWPKDPRLKNLGKWIRSGTEEGLYPFALYVLTTQGWTVEQVKSLCDEVVESYKTNKYYHYAWFVYGRKPTEEK